MPTRSGRGFDETGLTELGVFVDEHGKMPDLVVYLRDKHWLVLLLEAASSHGPVDAQRHGELGRLLVDPRHGDAGVNGPHQPPAGRTGRAAAAWLSCADGRGVGRSQDGRAPGRSTTAAAAAPWTGARTRHAGYWQSQKRRKIVEQVFGWMKTVGGGRKLRFAGRARNRCWLELTAAAYNLVRMARLETAAA